MGTATARRHMADCTALAEQNSALSASRRRSISPNDKGSLKSQISHFQAAYFLPCLTPSYPIFAISFSTQAIISPKAGRAVWRAM